jgi:hypothetical protein
MFSERMVRLAQTMHLSCIKISTISNELNQASTWASWPRSIICCVQNDFWAYGIFSTNRAPILNRPQHYLQIDQNEISHYPHHLGVSSSASKIICEAVVRSALTVLLLEMDRIELPKRFLILWYVRRKPCIYLVSRLALYQMNWIKHPLELRHLGVLSGASKVIYEPTVCLAQTVHLSWTIKNTISKRTKTRFHMTHVTLEFHRVRPKWFLRLLFVRHKPCTYLASRLALSLNGLNRASTWVLSPSSSTRCVQNDFWAYDMFGPNYAPILHQHSD